MNGNLKLYLVNGRVRLFLKEVDRHIAPVLAECGFTPEQGRVERLYAERMFGCGTHYISLTINLHPRDLPNSCNVMLGDGLRTWPERDWNSVALWSLARAHPMGSEASEYLLASSDVRHIVDRMRRDLSTFAADFLRGNLTAFRAVRASVNRHRPPYFINGRIDPESDALKERFSS